VSFMATNRARISFREAEGSLYFYKRAPLVFVLNNLNPFHICTLCWYFSSVGFHVFLIGF
jgi:hypothetical protein